MKPDPSMTFGTPEGQELARKRAVLASLEDKLADAELKLVTLQARLQTFEGEYLRVVGVRYAELDRIEAEIANLLSGQAPQDTERAHVAEAARQNAQKTAQAVSEAAPVDDQDEAFAPSDDLKDLYRKAAKAFHPDLTFDPEERLRRQEFMARANRVYEDGDLLSLEQLLREWQNRPESVQGDGVGAELIRTVREIAQIKDRLKAIKAIMASLKDTDLYRLRKMAREARAEGRDLLAEMAASIDLQTENAKLRLKTALKGSPV